MADKTLLDAIVEANTARASGNSSVRAALPAGAMPFVITCMDPRLVGVLLPALGLEGLEVPQAKFAGGVVRTGDVSGTRSVLAAAVFNMASEVLVVGHTDCRMGRVSSLDLRSGLARLGVRTDAFEGQDPSAWMGIFSGETQAIRSSVDALRSDPRIPPAMAVHGILYNIHSRRIEVIVRGYDAARGSAAGAAMSAPGGMRPGPVDWASPPPQVFGTPGLAPSGAGPVSFGSPPPSIGAGAAPPLGAGPVSFGAPPPPIAPPGLSPPPSFPAPPAMAVPQMPAPAEIHLGDEDPPSPPPEAPSTPKTRMKDRKRSKGKDSPFDRAQEMLDRLRRDE